MPVFTSNMEVCQTMSEPELDPGIKEVTLFIFAVVVFGASLVGAAVIIWKALCGYG